MTDRRPTGPGATERLRLEQHLLRAAQALPAHEREAWLRTAEPDRSELVERVLAQLELAQALDEDYEFPAPPVRRPHQAGDTVGAYVLGDRIGIGGMGDVFSAWDGEAGREVALKLLDPLRTSEAARLRLQQEGRLLAALEHPNVARTYRTGVHFEEGAEEASHGTAYIAMERVRGARDLARFFAEESPGQAERLRLVSEACAAVQHGHEHGILHLDLKPSNLLVDDERRVRLIDFGIGRQMGDSGSSGLTRTGDLLGTLGAMAPEQFSPDRGGLTVRTDVFGLGLVLFEALTGEPRGPAEGPEALEMAREGHVPDPRAIQGSLPAALAWIVQRATEPRPQDRYATVADLARDLEAYAGSQPLDAGPRTRRYHLQLFVRRNRTTVFAAGAVFLALVGGGASTWRGARSQVRAAEVQRTAIEDQLRVLSMRALTLPKTDRDDAAQSLYDSGIQFALQSFGEDHLAYRGMLGQKAEHLVQLDRFDEAEPLLLRCLELRDPVTEARPYGFICRDLMHVEASRGNHAAAIEYADRALQMFEPDDRAVRSVRAERACSLYYLDESRRFEAIAEVRDAVDTEDSISWLSRAAEARVYDLVREYAEGLQDWETAYRYGWVAATLQDTFLELNDKERYLDWSVLAGYAIHLEDQPAFLKATEHAWSGLNALDPTGHKTLEVGFARAGALANAGDFQGAIALLRLVETRYPPSHPNIARNRGLLGTLEAVLAERTPTPAPAADEAPLPTESDR